MLTMRLHIRTTHILIMNAQAGDELITDYGHQYFYYETSTVGGSHGDHKMPDYECGMPQLVVASRRGEVEQVSALLASYRGDSVVAGSAATAGSGESTYNGNVNGKAAPAAKELVAALKEAAVQGHGDVIAALVDAGADVHTRDVGGGTLLHIAVERFRVEKGTRIDVVSVLLAKGADPNAVRNDGSTALHACAMFGSDYLTAQALIRAGADVDTTGQ